VVFYLQGSSLVRGELEQRGRAIAAGLARESKYGVLTEDRSTLDELAREVAGGTKDIVYVAVVTNGKVLAQHPKTDIPELEVFRKAGLKGSAGTRYDTPGGDEFFDLRRPSPTPAPPRRPPPADGGDELDFSSPRVQPLPPLPPARRPPPDPRPMACGEVRRHLRTQLRRGPSNISSRAR
jgi:hypothetical protein